MQCRLSRSTVAVWLAVVLALTGEASRAQDIAVPAPPKLGFKSHYLADFETGAVLAEADADEQLPPASLTKLMTAYVVFSALRDGAIRLDDDVPISEKAWRTGGTRMFVEVGSHVSAEDLIHGMLIQSGNDASVALAEHVAGTVPKFVELMNEQAARLGMTNTLFRMCLF